jgi:carboxyl-terminal processing protease
MNISKKILFAIGLSGCLSIAAINVDSGKYFEMAKNLEIFANIYKELNKNYVDELDPAKLMRVGIDAMLNSLDPYTNYYSESDVEEARIITEGRYSGIGAGVKQIGDYPVITDVYENCPAFKAGIRAGDVIVAVDGQSAKGKNPDSVYDIMKGAPGTEMEITIRKPGATKDSKVKIKRDEVDVPNVPYSGMVSNDVGYVNLTTFSRDAGPNVQKAIAALKEKNPDMKSVVLDLRGNGGGLLNEGVNLVNVFVPKGELVVSTRGKVVDWDHSYKTTNAPYDEKMPVVVLVDKGTASSSEIVSGSLQDLDRAVIMGQRTYGKGLVQNFHEVGYNARMKLTTSKYYIPSGRCIQGVSYKNGVPVNIPDSLRTPFKTRSGRKVLDGGGITPDIYIDKDIKSAVVKSLVDQNIIFNYVTQYVLEHPTAPAIVSDLRFNDFENFTQFVLNKNFNADTETDKLIVKLGEEANKEHYNETIGNELKAMQAKLNTAKKAEIAAFKMDLIHLIEKEIASRYYFEKGKVQIGLRNDKEVDEAVKLLHDSARYTSLLKKQ